MATAHSLADSSDDQFVDTCDGSSAIERAHARALADRLFFAGFFALPWLWVIDAWFFAPHADARNSRADAHIAKRVRASRTLASIAFAVFIAWSLTFYFGSSKVFGDAFFERWSATTRQGAA